MNLIQKLPGSTWGCSARTLRTTTQAMVLSVAEYCAPVCFVSKIDTQINCALRIVAGAVDPTEYEWLYILSNIPPPHISAKKCKKIKADPDPPIHMDIESAPAKHRLRSRNPFWQFYQDRNNLNELKDRWGDWWRQATVTNKQLIEYPTVKVKGLELPRRLWLRMNRFRTGRGCCAFLVHRWNFAESPLCECGEIQTPLVQ